MVFHKKRGYGKGTVLEIRARQGMGKGQTDQITQDSYPPKADGQASLPLATIKGNPRVVFF